MKRYALKTLKYALYAIVVGLVSYFLVGCKVVKEIHDSTRVEVPVNVTTQKNDQHLKFGHLDAL